MRILVFLHGTSIMHAAGLGCGREERVRQSRGRETSVLDFASYVPTDDAVEKLNLWARHGAKIEYLSSHRTREDVAIDERVLASHGFPIGPVYWRADAESYEEIVRRVGPDLDVEDDCESIGGARQTVASRLGGEQGAVPCCIVPEFGGLGHLPNDPAYLVRF
jgi:hypothetical protein